MKNIRRLAFLLFLAFIFVSHPVAAAAPPTCDAKVALPETLACCTTLPGKFYMANNCLKNILRVTSTNFIMDLVNGLNNVVRIVLIMAIIVLGFRIATSSIQVRKMKGEIGLFVVKIALVIGFLSPDIITGQPMLSTYINGLLSFASIMTSLVLGSIVNNPSQDQIWIYADQALNGLFGAVGDGLGNISGFTGLDNIDYTKTFTLIVALLLSGALGIMLILLVVGTIISFVLAFVVALYVQYSSLIALTFLLAIAPIILPMMLFDNKTTKGIFNSWLGLVLSYCLQPIILAAYCGVMIVIFAQTIGFNLVNPLAPPPPGTILSILNNDVTATCVLFDVLGFQIKATCLNGAFWTTDMLLTFGMLLVITLLLSLGMKAFLLGLSALTERITTIGNSLGVSIVQGPMEIAFGEFDHGKLSAGFDDRLTGIAGGVTGGGVYSARNIIGKVARAPFRIFGKD